MHEHTNLLRRIVFYKALIEAITVGYPTLQINKSKESLLNWYQGMNRRHVINGRPIHVEGVNDETTIESLTMEQVIRLFEIRYSDYFGFQHNMEHYIIGLRLAVKNDTRPMIRLAAAEARLIELQQLPTFTVWYKTASYDEDGERARGSNWHKDTCLPGDFASEKEYLAWVVEQDYDECWGFITDTDYQKMIADEHRHEMEAMCQQIMSAHKITQVDSEEFFMKLEELCEEQQGRFESELSGMEEDGLCGGFGMTIGQYHEDRNFVRGRKESNARQWDELRTYLNEKFPIFAAMMRQKQLVAV